MFGPEFNMAHELAIALQHTMGVGNFISIQKFCLIQSLLPHRIAFRFKFGAGLPFRKLVAIGYLVTNFE